jgi:hypothetical protein
MSYPRHSRFQFVFESQTLRKRRFRKKTKALLYRIRKKGLNKTSRRRRLYKIIRKKFLGLKSSLQTSLLKLFYKPLAHASSSTYKTFYTKNPLQPLTSFNHRLKSSIILTAPKRLKRAMLIATAPRFRSKLRFQISKKLIETRAVPKSNKPPFLYFKTSATLVKLGLPKSDSTTKFKALFFAALVHTITKSALKSVNTTETSLLSFFTLFRNSYLLSKCLFYQNALYLSIRRHEFEKYTKSNYFITNIASKLYKNSLHNIINLNRRIPILDSRIDSSSVQDTTNSLQHELNFEFTLQPKTTLTALTILTEHFITSQFFREITTSKTYKHFPRAVVSFTRLQDAGRHPSSILNLDVNSANSMHDGIKSSNLFTNFKTTLLSKVDSSSLLSLQFNHNTKLFLLRKQLRGNLHQTDTFYANLKARRVAKSASGNFHVSPYFNLRLRLNVFLQTIRFISIKLVALRRVASAAKALTKSRRQARKSLQPKPKTLRNGSKAERKKIYQPVSKQIQKLAKHLKFSKQDTLGSRYSELKCVKLKYWNRARTMRLSTNFSTSRRLNTYLGVRKRYYSLRRENFLVYVRRLTMPPSTLRGKKRFQRGRMRLYVPLKLRKQLKSSQKARKRLKNKSRPYRKRRTYGRKFVFFRNQKTFKFKQLNFKKRISTKFK